MFGNNDDVTHFSLNNFYQKITPNVNNKDFTTLDYIRFGWNQIKFGWGLFFWPKFDRNEVICLLGYHYIDSFSKLII